MRAPRGSVLVFGTGSVAVGVVASRLATSGAPITLVSHSPSAAERLRPGVRIIAGDAATARTTVFEPQSVLCSGDSESVSSAIVDASAIVVAVSAGEEASISTVLRAGLQRRTSPATVLVCSNTPDGAAKLGARAGAGSATLAGHAFAGVLVDQIVTCDTTARERPTLRSEPHRDLLVEAVEAGPPPSSMPGWTVSHDFAQALKVKLCSFSAGHAAAAYLGAVRGHLRIDAALRDPEVAVVARETVEEGMAAVGLELPPRHGSPFAALLGHRVRSASVVDELLARYGNPVLRDTVERVGRDPWRKLGRDDRICAPALLALEARRSADALAVTGAAALLTLRADPATPEALRRSPVGDLLTAVAQIPSDHEFTALVTTALGVLARTRSPLSALNALRGTPGVARPRDVPVPAPALPVGAMVAS